LEAADEIIQSTGGDLVMTMRRVASAFDYLFHFIQLQDKREKRLKSIKEVGCDAEGKISMASVCEYDTLNDSWTFFESSGGRQRCYGQESDPKVYQEMQRILRKLSCLSPVRNDCYSLIKE
jgi:hypothetical protein